MTFLDGSLPEALERVSSARLLVVGDVMLDRYWFGDVSRISPEAPVPVVKIERREERLGGAANVARNIVALGASSRLLSVVGEDEAGRALARLLAESGVAAGLVVDAEIGTTVKLRVIGRQQQLLRIDFETLPSREVLRENLEEFSSRLPECDAVVLSDYGKGGLAHIADMIRLAKGAGKPILVDPKGEDFSRYAGATVITPNRSEFQAVAGRWRTEAELDEKAWKMREALSLEALLITRSEEGMSLYLAGEKRHETAVAREVFDVSGAGDTVIATLAALIAARCAWSEAIRAANLAAGVVVGKLGTAVASRDELLRMFSNTEGAQAAC
ncbi:MAG: D-glycero-beta-D-manno-heptose-7-phosphate kinase [Zoogloeaceae bacterium]|jgi:rfaE bifunctional protein kinase chain/domain|nr:D-glycero-beta-D-manno-heptose-7-phosphate kinase [Zoogloeaceae bacterium]